MYEYTVEEVAMATPTTLSLKLRVVPGGKILTYQPGQYAGISFRSRMRPTAVRCFSIASSPTQQDVLEFGIRVGGKYTKRLAQIKPGDTVHVQGPYGGFIFDAARHSQVVLLAGGIGITPMLSMLRFATVTQLANRMSLVCSIRTQDDAPYLDELKAIAAKNPNVSLYFAVGDGPTDKLPGTVFQGRINPDVMRAVCPDTVADKTFFLCGPPPFMQSLVDMLHDQGAPEPNIITEAFSQSHKRQTSKARGWPFNIYALGAVGTAVASVSLMANDLIKSIAPTLLPTKLSAKGQENNGVPANRQEDLDRMINGLSPLASSGGPSDAVITANQEVADAQAKADEVNAANAAAAGKTPAPSAKKSTTSPSPSKSSGTSGAAASPAPSPTPAPTPAPAPKPTPVCTTSPSGTVTCN